MKVFVAALLAVSLTVSASDAKRSQRIEGTWRSDREATMAFTRKYNKLLPKTESFYSSMVGRLTLTISEAQIHSVLPDWDVSIDGKLHHMVGFDSLKPYSVVFSREDVVVVVSDNPVTGRAEATTYNFTGPDSFWVYSGGSEQELPGAHLREYFRRVQKAK
jgi:hypothetical protein